MYNLLKLLIGERNIGRLEYLLRPSQKNRWGGPFNGQQYRQRIFCDILNQLSIKAIVETGTHRGSTTALFAETGLPVYSVEICPRHLAFAKMRLARHRSRVHLYLDDSRAFLASLAQDSSVPRNHVFFYLDAHWGDDLPLREEIETIFSNWDRATVMIDDFCVPDSDYGFDAFGDDKKLNLDYLKPVTARFQVHVYFPAADALQETGARRGSVVLCRESEVAARLDAVETLRRHTPR